MSVSEPRGFVAAGVASGIKPSGALDLALVATADGRPAAAAGVFTTNKAAAAAVQVSREHLVATGGRAVAVACSSGNANAATGAKGLEDARRICATVGDGLEVAPEQVLLCQTGLIGIPLPAAPFEAGLPELVGGLAPGRDAAAAAARAIMTTDTVPKEAVRRHPSGFCVGAMAKGAAMLAPNMATMLAVITTDAAAETGDLAVALAAAVEGSFNRLSVDGCTSTNDTVFVLANGASAVSADRTTLAGMLGEVCAQLAAAMAADAEGATRVCQVVVNGAVDDDEAHRAARAVAESQLVQCSINGADPYWGRVVSELGAARIGFDLDRVEVRYGRTVVCSKGTAVDHDLEALRRYMVEPTIEIVCDLGLGRGTAAVLTTDLGHGYIDENRTTS